MMGVQVSVDQLSASNKVLAADMGRVVPVGVNGGSTTSGECWAATAGTGETAGEVDTAGEGSGVTRTGSGGNGDPAQPGMLFHTMM